MKARTLVPALLLVTPSLAAAAPAEPLAPAVAGVAADPDVVGGHAVAEGDWLDTAAIYFGNEAGCTGVLVAPDLVLTAGHCAGGITAVKLATNDLGKPGELIAVTQTIRHPNSWSTYDAAILVLERPSTVTPRLIAQGCVIDRYLDQGSPVTIVGYGAIDEWGEEYVNTLMEATTTVTDPDCTKLESGCNREVSPGGELGAGGMGIDSCFGDSGGPLYLLTEKGDFVVGLTSRAYDTVEVPCREGGIYVRPDALVGWIERETGRTLEQPVCNLAPLPSADPIEVTAGEAAGTLVTPNDPDAGDRHVFTVAEAPAHGQVTVGPAGEVMYEAAGGYEGPDRFVITVSDDGEPSLSGEVEVAVTVLAAATGCGCATGRGRGDAGATWLLAALAAAVATGYRRWRRHGMDPARGRVPQPGGGRTHRVG